jgi:hypothetical protein
LRQWGRNLQKWVAMPRECSRDGSPRPDTFIPACRGEGQARQPTELARPAVDGSAWLGMVGLVAGCIARSLWCTDGAGVGRPRCGTNQLAGTCRHCWRQAATGSGGRLLCCRIKRRSSTYPTMRDDWILNPVCLWHGRTGRSTSQVNITYGPRQRHS